MSNKLPKPYPQNPSYYSWKVIDAPDPFWHERLFRRIDLKESAAAGDWPNGIVFQNIRTGEKQVCWNGKLLEIGSLEVSTGNLKRKGTSRIS
jgi:hypothetical protein